MWWVNTSSVWRSNYTQGYGKFKIFKLWKSKVPNWIFCFQISDRVDLLLNHNSCAKSAFLRALNVGTTWETRNTPHFLILLQIPLPSIATTVFVSPYFRSIPSLIAISVQLLSRPEDKFDISDIMECRITQGIYVSANKSIF